jgi:hypothetical protein
LIGDITDEFLTELSDFLRTNRCKPLFLENTLRFLKKIDGKTSKSHRTDIAEAFMETFKLRQFVGTNRSLFIELITLFVSSEMRKWEPIVDQCLSIGPDFDLGVQLALKLMEKIDSRKAKTWFNSVMRLEVSADLLVTFLRMCEELIQKADRAFTRDEYSILMEKTKPFLGKHANEVCRCYSKLNESLHTLLFQDLCRLDELPDPVIGLIANLATKISSPTDTLSDVLFRTDNQKIVDVLVSYYNSSHELGAFFPTCCPYWRTMGH